MYDRQGGLFTFEVLTGLSYHCFEGITAGSIGLPRNSKGGGAVKTKCRKLLEEYRAAVDEHITHPKFVSSHLRLVLARAELEEHLMVPWPKRVQREFVAWSSSGSGIKTSG